MFYLNDVKYQINVAIIRNKISIFAPESKQKSNEGTKIAVSRFNGLSKDDRLQIYGFFRLVVQTQAKI
jgi:hypothetical protein